MTVYNYISKKNKISSKMDKITARNQDKLLTVITPLFIRYKSELLIFGI